MRRVALVVACVVLACICWSRLAGAADDAPVLERVVMVSRHGIRSPTRRVEILEALTKHKWPAWPVGPGEMTEHGARNLALMADFLRDTYRTAKLLPEHGCPAPSAVAVWSDVADHRTRQSGDIFADRLAPGCRFESRHAVMGTVDPLFDASRTNSCPIGLIATSGAFAAAVRQAAGPVNPEERHALDVLQEILAPDACRPNGKGICLVPAADASPERKAAAVGFALPIAEAIYLEYAQGMPPTEIGWGKAVDAATVAAIMPIHNRGMAIFRRAPTLSARRSAVMARTILALLRGQSRPDGAPPIGPDAKVVMIAGHDSNLLFMASLMGLDWQLPDQPSLTPPDGTLAFEVWRAPVSGRRTLRVVLYAQTLAQLRDATPLDKSHPPDVVRVVPDACATAGHGDCELTVFAAAAERRVGSLCKK